jgi:hypothetical protein
MAAGLLLVGAAAFAQPPVTTTTVQKNLVETFVDVIPTCEEGGPLYTITLTSTLVMHETVFDDARVHATFTQTGTFVAVPLEAGLPSYTGRSPSRAGSTRTTRSSTAPSPSTCMPPALMGRGSGSTPPSTSTSGPTARSTSSSTATRSP